MSDGIYTIAKTAMLGVTVAACYYDPKCSKNAKILVAIGAAAITVFRLYNEFSNQNDKDKHRFGIDMLQAFGQLLVGGPFDPNLEDIGPSFGRARGLSRVGAAFAPAIEILLACLHTRP